jgi:hypothetical protein
MPKAIKKMVLLKPVDGYPRVDKLYILQLPQRLSDDIYRLRLINNRISRQNRLHLHIDRLPCQLGGSPSCCFSHPVQLGNRHPVGIPHRSAQATKTWLEPGMHMVKVSFLQNEVVSMC